MYSQYLKEGETPLLTDTKPETGETVILTDSRVIHIRNGEVLYAESYNETSMIKFCDSSFSLVTDPRMAENIVIMHIIFTSRLSMYVRRREVSVCCLSGFAKMSGIASALHIRCRKRTYERYLCPEAKSMNIRVLAVIIVAFLVMLFAISFAEKLPILVLLIPITPIAVIVALTLMKRNKNSMEWKYRNELYGIHPDVGNRG